MEWRRGTYPGRVTAMNGPVVAGVTDDGSGFIAGLIDAGDALVLDEIRLDADGVLAVGGIETTFLTGRDPEGTLRMWSVEEFYVNAQDLAAGELDDEEPLIEEIELPEHYTWAASVATERDDFMLAMTGRAETTQVEVRVLYALDLPVLDQHRHPAAPGLLGGRPVVAHRAKQPVWVVTDAGVCWSDPWLLDEMQDEVHWSDVDLPAGMVATYAAVGMKGWLGGWAPGADGDRPVLVRHGRGTEPEVVPAPVTRLRPDAAGPRVLLLEPDRLDDMPAMVTASVDGNALWFPDAAEDGGWARVAVPDGDGPLWAAGSGAGWVGVIIGTSVWVAHHPNG
ncbi:hypothetical protein GUY44_17250 [Pimelobacter simplex]|uniref:hypothetical protein n=1 Tax=Nocardioides simplex TaxID=2045 RepID=UPI0008E38111|nr:hypothetical protein [Pimelobacter simplex]MCG8152238.1 hypothetical protein [Pimelobacter simplex]GEB14354.1 hypothetical protein NSI01_26690 [Pimelobacter simplex]SFM30712.1 hypothetical protein SAMN05421671_1065 [Pimelobacter simplex]